MPVTEPQRQYYSGHRRCHVIHSQIVTDINGIIVYIESGFLGHMNDAQQLAFMAKIGPGEELDFPADCYLLADKIYPIRYRIITPYTAAQLQRKQGREQQKCRTFNRHLSSYRVTVEHALANLMSYRATGAVWRHSRRLLGRTVKICGGLVNRRREIGLNF